MPLLYAPRTHRIFFVFCCEAKRKTIYQLAINSGLRQNCPAERKQNMLKMILKFLPLPLDFCNIADVIISTHSCSENLRRHLRLHLIIKAAKRKLGVQYLFRHTLLLFSNHNGFTNSPLTSFAIWLNSRLYSKSPYEISR
jgi:hypothetical protein